MKELANIDCFLLDMDGTFYLEDELIEGALEFINLLERQNKKYIFLTNNSSKNSKNYQQKLARLGVSVSLEQIVTSGEVAANYIVEQNSMPRVYVVGTSALKEQFSEMGIQVAGDKAPDLDYIVVGFDTTLTYEKLWIAHDLILAGVNYLATNPDYVCPLKEGRTKPDCGSIISLLETSTGQDPLVIGKPNSIMIDYLSSLAGVAKNKIAMIGDRLYTDIKTANRGNITSILTLSGEADRPDISKSTQSPDYIIESLQELTEKLAEIN